MGRWLITGLITAGLIACSGSPSQPGELPLRHLTTQEYNNTIRDLFGYRDNTAWLSDDPDYEAPEGLAATFEPETIIWPYTFPSERGVDGFEGFAEGQVASAYGVEQYSSAAAHFSRFTLTAPEFSTCGPWQDIADDQKTQCAQQSIERFARLAYRRPLATEDANRLSAFHTSNVSTWGVDNGTILTVQGILQSPHFLFLVEYGSNDSVDSSLGANTQALSSWDMASRLSFFFWDSMPDQALFEAAANNALTTREQIEAQALRMVQDPKARGAVIAFHRQWLEIDEVYNNRADLTTYAPRYGKVANDVLGYAGLEAAEEIWSGTLIGMRRAMDYEADLFIEKTIFEGGANLASLLQDHHGYVSYITVGFGEDSWQANTAEIYGVTSDDYLAGESITYQMADGNLPYGITLVPATLPNSQRAGVLTLGAVLAGRAHPVHPSPVGRGIFILERIACEHIGQPPDAAADATPPDTPHAESTNRERLEAATAAPGCAVCHDRINPAGFAFEHYDSLGGFRFRDNGQVVDASGTVPLEHDSPIQFTRAVELADALAESSQVHDCYAQHWIRYAIGRQTTDTDNDAVTALQDQFRENDGNIRQLMVDIATSNLFRYRRVGVEP